MHAAARESADGHRPTVVAILRDEAAYLLEWLAHHRSVGVADFLLYDHGSVDGTRALLRRLAAAGLLRWIDWSRPPGPAAQLLAYDEALLSRRIDTPWAAFVDLDEFLVPRVAPDLPTLLRDLGDEAGGIAANWTVFGSDGHERATSGPVARRFRQALPESHPMNRMTKCLVRVDALVSQRIHRSLLRHGRPLDGSGRPLRRNGNGLRSAERAAALLQVNHYMLKSREEFAAKLARGSANDAGGRGLVNRSWPLFERISAAASEPDGAIDRFLPAAEAERSRLEALLAVPAETEGAAGAPLALAGDLAARLERFNAPLYPLWRAVQRKDATPGEVAAAIHPYIVL